MSHDLNEIYRNTVQTVKTLVTESGVAPETIAGIGISNQRETTAIWDKATGEPLEEAIVWQCGRASGITQEIAEQVEEKKDMREAMIYLQKYGISTTLAARIYQHYGQSVYRVIEENPYQIVGLGPDESYWNEPNNRAEKFA